MAKKVKEVWVSDVVDGVEFDSNKDQIEFDKKIQSKEWYLKIAKDVLENRIDEDEIATSVEVEKNDGVFVLKLGFSLSEFISEELYDDGLENSYFDSILSGVSTDDYDEIDEDITESISEYINSKIDDYSEEIDSMIKIKVA